MKLRGLILNMGLYQMSIDHAISTFLSWANKRKTIRAKGEHFSRELILMFQFKEPLLNLEH